MKTFVCVSVFLCFCVKMFFNTCLFQKTQDSKLLYCGLLKQCEACYNRNTRKSFKYPADFFQISSWISSFPLMSPNINWFKPRFKVQLCVLKQIIDRVFSQKKFLRIWFKRSTKCSNFIQVSNHDCVMFQTLPKQLKLFLKAPKQLNPSWLQ